MVSNKIMVMGSASKGGINPDVAAKAVERLRELSDGGEWEATTDGGWPRFGWGKVLQVGMYDGWPHWKPVPSVCINGTLGAEWHPFYSISEIRRIGQPDPSALGGSESHES